MEQEIESRGIHIPSAFCHRRRRHHEEEDKEEEGRDVEDGTVKNRSLPLSTLIEMLKQKTGKDDIDVGKLRLTLFEIFKEDSSPKVKKFIKFVFNKLQHHAGGESEEQEGGFLEMVGSLALKFLKHKLNENEEHVEPAMETHIANNQEVYAGDRRDSVVEGGIVMSGCQSDKKSADANPSGNPGKAYGAFSNAIQLIIQETDAQVTNQELVLKARKLLKNLVSIAGITIFIILVC